MNITAIATTAPRGDDCLLVVSTSAGTGIAAVAAAAAPSAVTLGKRLAGEDPRAVPTLWQRLAPPSGADETAVLAAAALDIALWDAKAKAGNAPLWRLLGGTRPRARACLVIGQAAAADIDATGSLARELGINDCKLILVDDEGVNAARLDALRKALARDAVPPVLRILVDAPWPVERIVRCVSELERRFDVASVELAANAETPDVLKRISDALFAAACGGRSLATVNDLLPWFRQRALDIVQIDVRRTGITGALQIADAAFGLELPVAFCESPADVGAQLASAIPYFGGMEVAVPSGAAAFAAPPTRIEAGRVTAGDDPGIGWHVEPDLLAAVADGGQPA